SAQPLRVSPAGASAVLVKVNSHTRQESESTLSVVMWTIHPASGNASDQLCRPAEAGRHSLSFCRGFSASGIRSADHLLGVVRAVETEDGRLVVVNRFQVDGSSPDVLDIRQRVPGLVQLQIYPIMLVSQQQFAPVAVVPVDRVDPRLAEVG